MEYSDTLLRNIDLMNDVLNAIGASELNENTDFLIDQDSLGYYHMRINVVSDRKTAPLVIFLEGDGMRLDVCGVLEAFEWSNEDILTTSDRIKDFFKKLFTSHILMESCGSASAKSRMFLFDKRGDFIDKYALRGFIQKYSGWECDKYLFFPLY